MKNLIATLFVSYPLRKHEFEEKIRQFLSKNYTNFEENPFIVGGGNVDLSFTFKTPVRDKKEFETFIKPFMDKFDLLEPYVEYEDEKDYLKNQEYQKKVQKKQDSLKDDLKGVYLALKDKYKGDELVLSDIDHIFKHSIPPAWAVK